MKSFIHPTGFVQAVGRNLYDGKGNPLVLRGVNFGDWFVQEFWMATSCVGDIYKTNYTQKRALEVMEKNPNLSKEQILEVQKVYIDHFIKEEDFANVAKLNLNVIRINFSCYNITLDGYQLNPWFFEKFDWALDMCEKYHLYCIIDNHGAIGSQNQDHHSGNDDTFDLYGNEKNMAATVEVWKAIASRYKDRTCVACYDLLNETRSAPGKFSGKVQFDFYDRLYKAIREIDPHHMIMMECFTFPTHGVHPKKYSWENVCYSYHFYNLTPFLQRFCLWTYKFMDFIKGYDVPIIMGEFSCWKKEKDWYVTFSSFEKKGWSYLCWTYKANNYVFKRTSFMNDKKKMWGLYEIEQEPVNLATATYEEIVSAYEKVETKNAHTTIIYDAFYHHFVLKDR